MVRKLTKKAVKSLLLNGSDTNTALAYSIGILIGLFPLHGLRLVTIALIALVCSLNLPAMIIGLGFTVLCPGLYSVFTSIFNTIGSTSGGILKLVLAGVLIIPAVYNLSKLLSLSFSHEAEAKKFAWASGLGSFAGYALLYDLKAGLAICGLVLLIVIARGLSTLALSSGFILGILIYAMAKMVLFKDSLPILLSGYESINDFVTLLMNGHYEYLLTLLMDLLIAASAFPIFKNIYSCKSIQQTRYSRLYVFHDADGFRWSKIERTVLVSAILVIMFGNIFFTGLLGSGTFASSTMKDTEVTSGTTDTSLNSITKNKTSNKTYGFYVDWDPKSLASFKKNASLIDVLIPGWYQLNDQLGVTGTINKEVMDIATKNNVKVMPLVNNYVNEKWNGNLVKAIISTKANRDKFINQLKTEALKNGFCGFNIDFENLDDECKNNYSLFISELYSSFKAAKLQLTVDVQPQKSAYDLEKLATSTDSIILMMYDEHNEKSSSGPIASKDWYENILKNIKVPADKIIVGLGLYGYDWTNKESGKVTSMSSSEVMQLYRSNKAAIKWDTKYCNPTFNYMNGKESHTLWFNDSIVAYNQISFSQKLGIHQFSLWRLGSEDEKLWSVFSSLDNLKESITDLSISEETVDTTDLSNTTTQGEIIYNLSKSKIYLGKRLKLQSDDTLSVIDYNSTYIGGLGEGTDPKQKKIALTFDDGPTKEYTPQILDILKRYNIKATFFVIGKNAWSNPNILKRIYNEGHDIGNHTYDHKDLPQYSILTTRVQLNMTNKIIEILTGHSTLLFRQPYNVEWDLSSPGEAAVFKGIDSMGYALIGSAIDPKDWEGHPSNEIVSSINQQLGTGNIVLLHDDGVNVKNTVKTLPLIIEDLKSKGYSFETVSTLMNKDRSSVMPTVKIQESASIMAINLLLTLKSSFNLFVRILFISATIIGVLRFVLLIFFATRQKKKHMQKKFSGIFTPMASIVVAAYNEEKVICKTVESILESDYPNIEVIVVNDGSTDRTAEAVKQRFGDHPKVRLISKENGGKSSSVNGGFKEAYGEIVVVIDADTILDSKAVSLMVRHFENDEVAAVSGNVKVGNKNNFITKCQHIEYVTGLNLERRAFDELNCIPVVPGAIGAWRKEYVKAAGYYKEDTLAEDADITLTFLEQGFKIVYEEGARAYTEAPEDLDGFLKQRLRWSYGTLQCLWKHRKSLFNKDNKILGFAALPNMWLYQFVFQALTPISEVIFFMGLFGAKPLLAVLTYMVFFIIDYLITLYAFNLEKEDTKPLRLYFFQRAAYKLIMTFVVYKSLFSALKGVKVGWNKLLRKGNVEKETPETEYQELIA